MNLPTLPGGRRPALLAAGLVGTIALSLSTTSTMSAFTARIANSTNTASTGYLLMKETLLDASGAPTSTVCTSTDGGSLATNSATCASINKYGGTANGLIPGGSANTTKIAISNAGTTAASAFSLTPTACGAAAGSVNGGASPAAVCAKIRVVISSGGTTVYSGTAAGLSAPINLLAALNKPSVAAGESIPFTIAVSLDPTADTTVAGFTVSQPLAWTFTS